MIHWAENVLREAIREWEEGHYPICFLKEELAAFVLSCNGLEWDLSVEGRDYEVIFGIEGPRALLYVHSLHPENPSAAVPDADVEALRERVAQQGTDFLMQWWELFDASECGDWGCEQGRLVALFDELVPHQGSVP